MYTFRPLLAWSHFCQASTAYRIHLRSTSSTDAPSQDRLEQSLYWSCFKSECEFRVELPLPQTELADLEHPHMFPTPPSPSTEGIQPLTYSEASLAWNNQKQITEEMSWYYYLTELALRRMGNRILNTFYTYPHATWMQISRFIHAAREFEIQLSNWTDNLPAVMQYSENLRSPANELSWCTGNRILEIQAWLYQPFLYFALHKSSSSIPNSIQHQNVTQDDEVLRGLIRAGMDTHLRIIQFRTVQHRHHGLWFDLRAITSSAIFLCGCLISGNILLPEDWEERFESILRQLRFWEVESPDLVRTRGVLEELRDEARLAVATRTAEK